VQSPAKPVGPAEAESALVANPAVAEAAAIGLPDELKGKILVCFCVLAKSAQASDALRDELKACVVREPG
jgi:acetyl-CoA synthetase